MGRKTIYIQTTKSETDASRIWEVSSPMSTKKCDRLVWWGAFLQWFQLNKMWSVVANVLDMDAILKHVKTLLAPLGEWIVLNPTEIKP